MITYRHLYSFEYSKYASYLKSLDSETLYSYFGTYAKPETIDMLVKRIVTEHSKHQFIVALDGDFEWVGVLHMALNGKECELGIIVRPENRRQGIADQLITQATLWCRNRGYLDIYMHCISRNTAIMNLVTKHNLKIEREYTEADARITLPTATWFSLSHEQVMKQLEWSRTAYKLSTTFI